MNRITDRDINVMAVCKGTERYVFLWEDGDVDQMQIVFGRFAANPHLSFTLYDAIVAGGRIREDAARRMEGKES